MNVWFIRNFDLPLYSKQQTMKHTLPQIIARYNRLLYAREALAQCNPDLLSFRIYEGRKYRRRILQLRRQTDKNIKRIENVIDKLFEPQMFVLMEPNAVHVCTIGAKGDGTDNIIATYESAYIEQDYFHFIIREKGVGGKVLAKYFTKHIVCISRKDK